MYTVRSATHKFIASYRRKEIAQTVSSGLPGSCVWYEPLEQEEVTR